MASARIASLLQDLENKGKELETDNNEATHRQLLDAARNLVDALESPAEKVMRMLYHEPFVYSITKVCVDLDLFALLMADDGSPKTTEFLAQATGAEQTLLASPPSDNLLERLLKHLATSSVIDEVDVDTFGPTPVTALLTTPECAGGVINMYDCEVQYYMHLPAFLKATGYRNPLDKDSASSLFRYATGLDMPYFDWLHRPENAAHREAFDRHMGFKTLSARWHESVPLGAVLGTEVRGDALLVDVGGGIGHDLRGFRAAHPEMAGKLVLQDTPGTVAGVAPGPGPGPPPFEVMGHDFFTPQPVKGANAYYMKMILHDWNDADCQRILSNIKPAMTPGFSKILVNEIVIPSKGASWFETGIDIIMLGAHASYERTERDWNRLAESAGLKIGKIWDCNGAMEKLIEMVVP
ncbi:O-methyltransferase [Xylariomycetidae sp. FL0641]|nr:O-methyltransferase [Xylariomycetidae sp. FL0641]